MCTSPNYMMWSGKYYPDTHKEKFDFVPHTKYETLLKSGVPFIQVPCGKCLECRQQSASNWADRLVFESMYHQYSYFITLTYDDEHCPASLDKAVIPAFIKRLRRYMKYHYNIENIKYFYCGEYGTGHGSRGLNPHYHILLFGAPLEDLSDTFYHIEDKREKKCLRPNKDPRSKFSKLIWNLWDRQGLIEVDLLEYSSCAYVAGYVEKKTNVNQTRKFKKLGLVPEFHSMSKGIGEEKFSLDMFSKGSLIVPKSGGAKISAIPRYYEKKLDKEFPWEFNELKERQAEKRRVRINTYLHSSSFLDVDNFAKEKRNIISHQRNL